MGRRTGRIARQNVSTFKEERPGMPLSESPGARIRGFFQELAYRMRASMRRIRRRRRMALSLMRDGFVPPLGRVKSWKTCRDDGACNSYVVVQVPRHVGTIASHRIKRAIRQGVEEGVGCGPECGKRRLFLVLTDLVKLVKRP